jgi:hypothetical protein
MLVSEISYIVRLLLFFFVPTVPMAAQDYCSLQVHVVDERGRPVPNVMVRVAEDEGNATQIERHNGVVRVCDLGVRPVRIRVGSSACRNMFVENVALAWRKTTDLTIVYDPSVCNIDSQVVYPSTAACFLLFRFVTSEGRPIPNVALVPRPIKTDPAQSDGAGRMLVTVAPGETIAASATKEGHVPVPLREVCEGYGRWRDKFVVLTEQ